MPVADLLRLKTARLTPQQITDFALEADRTRRASIRRGDLASAVEAQRERNALLAILT